MFADCCSDSPHRNADAHTHSCADVDAHSCADAHAHSCAHLCADLSSADH
jgi:hypothetical protein